MVKINPSLEPHQNCPSFEKCNTNKCPLHKSFFQLQNTAEDRSLKGWKRCRASKKVRQEIAQAFRIKWNGLTPREIDSIRKSVQMKKDLLFTHEKQLKTSLRGISEGLGGVQNDNN